MNRHDDPPPLPPPARDEDYHTLYTGEIPVPTGLVVVVLTLWFIWMSLEVVKAVVGRS